jgi:hypothetical protein
MPIRPRFSRKSIATLALVLLAACQSDVTPPPVTKTSPPVPAGANVVLQWHQASVEAIRITKPGPPMTARALAMLSTAMFDAWAAYDSLANGTRYGAELRRPADEFTAGNKAKAMSYAALETLLDLYPTEKTALDARMTSLGYNPATRSTDRATPEGIGHLAAQALLNYRHLDGSNQLGDLTQPDAAGNKVPYGDYTGYVAKNPAVSLLVPTLAASVPSPESWGPLTYVNQAGATVSPKFIAPHWGKVRPFAMTSGDQLRPPAPKRFGSPEYLVQLQEVVDVMANLTDRQKAIAEYWADGPTSETPPGHWHVFAMGVAERDRHSLDDDAKMFFALSNAVFDAGIATWDAKRTYDTSRPVTAIRYLLGGTQIKGWGGPGRNNVAMDGAAWMPFQPAFFPTPPFAEYTSGHSAFSSAAAEVLKRFTGSDNFGASATIAPRSFKAEPSAPEVAVVLTWPSFTEAADQAGLSRLYGGIHFRDADVTGRAIGRTAGAQAFQRAQAYWLGLIRP